MTLLTAHDDPTDALPRSEEASHAATPARTRARSIRSAPAWEKALTRHLAPGRFTASCEGRFHGCLNAYTLDRLQLIRFEVQPHHLWERPSSAAPSSQFLLPLDAAVDITQGDRRALVEPGQVVVLDTTLSYEITFDTASTAVVIRTPRQDLGITPLLVRLITGSVLGAESDLAGSLMPLVVRLAHDLIASAPRQSRRLAVNLTDLLTTLLLDHLASVAPGGSTQRMMLEITGYLEDHLGDPELSASAVASAHHVSPRYLRKLFQSHNLTITGLIRSQRLEACRRLLADPTLADESITSIAARSGFPDPARFSRSFKATYGYCPSDLRRKTHASSCAADAAPPACPRGSRS